jgi:hypothetical protein
MTLEAGRNTPERQVNFLVLPVKLGVKIYEGSLVVLDGEYAKPGAEEVDLIAVGRAEEYVDNSDGLDGDKSIKVKLGCFKFENDVNSPVTEVLRDCYIVDDETVSSSHEANTRSVAGKVISVETDGVWVQVMHTDVLEILENTDAIQAHTVQKHIFNTVVTATLSEINADKIIVPAVTGKKIVPLNYLITVNGTFTTGTDIKLQDDNDVPVVVVTALTAALGDGDKISSQAVIADVTDGPGFQGELTASKNLKLVANGEFDGGTSIRVSLDYDLA